MLAVYSKSKMMYTQIKRHFSRCLNKFGNKHFKVTLQLSIFLFFMCIKNKLFS